MKDAESLYLLIRSTINVMLDEFNRNLYMTHYDKLGQFDTDCAFEKGQLVGAQMVQDAVAANVRTWMSERGYSYEHVTRETDAHRY